jgi:cyclase
MHQHAHSHSRRDFFSRAFGSALAGASILEQAFLRASWARAQAPAADPNLFRIEKVADGVYAALARPQMVTNCNAAIFVNSRDVVVVDAHSKPSAAAALIAQIKKEVTTKPVRYLVNSHFHYDHTQGDAAYKAASARVDIIASETTRQLMTQLSRNRLKESLDSVPGQLEQVQARLARAASDPDKKYYAELIRQLKAYQSEMQSFPLEMPTITFEKTYAIKDPAGDLHLEFHGRAHTAGDIVVFSPQKRVVATGDVIIGFFPNVGDGYPRPWPATIDSIGELGFDRIIPGHGPVHPDRARMTQMRNFIQDVTGRIADAKKAGKPLDEVQKTLTVASIKTLQSGGYGEWVAGNLQNFTVYLGQRSVLEERLAGTIEAIYKNLDRA